MHHWSTLKRGCRLETILISLQHPNGWDANIVFDAVLVLKAILQLVRRSHSRAREQESKKHKLFLKLSSLIEVGKERNTIFGVRCN